MGKISDLLILKINQAVSESHMLIWYDPDKFYADWVASLTIQGLNILVYKTSFFKVRAQIEPFIDQPEPPRLLVYVPKDQAESQHALIELEVAGAILKPGAVPPTYNMRPSYIARQALQPIIGADAAQAIEKQVENGNINLAELEELAEQGSGLSKGVVSLIFGTGNPQDVALTFLSSAEHDADLVAKAAMPELASLLQTIYEFQPAIGINPAEYRKALVRFVLVSELLYRLPAPFPALLNSVPAASKPAAREACSVLASTWRNRRDICASYQAQAEQIETALDLRGMDFNLDQLKLLESFLGLEQRLVEAITTELINETQESLVTVAHERQSTFWPEQHSELQAQWALIAATGKLLLQARRVEKALKTIPNPDLTEIARSYTQADEPWCLLDTYHRNMERRIHHFDFDATGVHKLLEQLIAKARERYMQVGSLLAERFVRTYSAGKFALPSLQDQREIFEKQLKSSLLSGKIAFVWVDALRFEMGRELAETLAGEFDIILEPAVASAPTLTEIGMASLLPLPQEAPALYSPAESKLALRVGEISIKDRNERIAFLNSHTFLKTTNMRLEELLPSPKKSIREAIKAADLVLVTSQEIDELCEGDNVHLARRIMDDMLLELRRAFRILRDLGVKTIICTADHGYLFGEEVGGDMKIDPPGGNTVDLHRRVWVGYGGAADPAYLRASLNQFGWETDLEIAVPWNFACFKVKGGTRAYFHGGLSPQELFIPVLTIKPVKKQATAMQSFVWKLTPGTPKISTRFYSVQISGEAVSLFESQIPKVRLEVQLGSENVGMAISASYGFSDATGDIQLRPLADDPRKVEQNTITLMITKEPAEKKTIVNVVLLDAETGVELSRLDQIEMAFAL